LAGSAQGTWFFSPPVGPSIDPAKLEDVLAALSQNDEYWSTEAPATENDYCRENWAPLVFSAPGQSPTLRATIFYVGEGLFTLAVSGDVITQYPPELTEEERSTVPAEWFDLYPVVSDEWNEFLEVRRQGDLFRYPKAVLVDRECLGRILRNLFESQTLDPEVQWIMQMEYAQRYQRWFFFEE
jgi:hypothetical protein